MPNVGEAIGFGLLNATRNLAQRRQAEQAAQQLVSLIGPQFAQLGPAGEQFAQTLQQDPVQGLLALRRLQQVGLGPQVIMQSLQAQQASAQEQAAAQQEAQARQALAQAIGAGDFDRARVISAQTGIALPSGVPGPPSFQRVDDINPLDDVRQPGRFNPQTGRDEPIGPAVRVEAEQDLPSSIAEFNTARKQGLIPQDMSFLDFIGTKSSLQRGRTVFRQRPDGTFELIQGANQGELQNSTRTSLEKQNNAAANALSLVSQIENTLQPGDVGVVGSVQRTLQGVKGQLSAASSTVREDIQQSGSSVDASNFSPSINQTELLLNILAYNLAKLEGDPRVSDVDFKNFKRALQANGALASEEAIRNALAAVKQRAQTVIEMNNQQLSGNIPSTSEARQARLKELGLE